MNEYESGLSSILDFKVLLQAIEQSPSTIVITDTKGNIEYVNPKFTELTGYTGEEAKGINPSILKSGEHPASMYKQLWCTICSGKAWSGTFHNKKKNGELYWESARIAPIKDDGGKITHFVAIKEDITQMKKMEEENLKAKEQAEIANRAKSQFLANMSHEIRTPLNGIKGMIDLTLLTELSKEQKENLEIAEECVNSLMQVINDILDFSKIEAGKITIEDEEIHFRSFIESLMKPHIINAKEKELCIYYHIAKDIPDVLIGDSARLKQILNNLISNAIKFTEEGKVELIVENEGCSKEDRLKLKLQVLDTGIGIDEKDIGRLFKSFSQVDGTITRKYGGTGLGLAISRKLAQMMDGDMWVESKKGKGSSFCFNINLKVSDSKEVKKEIDREVALTATDKFNILLVEDDKINQRITKDMLVSKGHQVEIANNGIEAIHMLKDKSFDLILMDIQMAQMDGIEATKLIRKCEEERGIHTPIIALTAYAIKGDKEKFLSAGMDDYISKPFNMKELFRVVELSQINKAGELSPEKEGKGFSIEGYEKNVSHTSREATEAREEKYNLDYLMEKVNQLKTAIEAKDLNKIEWISKNIKEVLGDKDEESEIRKKFFKVQLAARRSDIKAIEDLFKETYALLEKRKS